MSRKGIFISSRCDTFFGKSAHGTHCKRMRMNLCLYLLDIANRVFSDKVELLGLKSALDILCSADGGTKWKA